MASCTSSEGTSILPAPQERRGVSRKGKESGWLPGSAGSQKVSTGLPQPSSETGARPLP